MAEIKIEETNWEELEEVRQYEQNSFSYEQAVEAYEESKETEQF